MLPIRESKNAENRQTGYVVNNMTKCTFHLVFPKFYCKVYFLEVQKLQVSPYEHKKIRKANFVLNIKFICLFTLILF